MTRRTRSLLIDNTFGKIFTGVSKTSDGTADKLIAGTKLLSKSIAQNKKFIVIPSNNLGNGQGLILSASESLLTQIKIAVAVASSGQPVTIVVLKGESYDTSTELGTYELASGVKTFAYNVSHQILSGEKIFVNITTSGSTRKASGLSLTFIYYGA
jgi:hypothetical protein